MKTITSRSNSEIQLVAQLDQRKHRMQQQRYKAEGFRTCSTLINNNAELVMLYVLENEIGHAYALTDEECFTVVTEPVMEKISGTKSASGIVGVFRIPPQPPASDLSTGIVLAQVTDPGNMGTLIRTAVAMGRTSVVVIEGSTDVWSPKVVQSTAGVLACAKIFTCSWQDLIEHKGTLSLCALVVEGGNPPEKLALQHSLLVVGNEAHGISDEWIADCDQHLTLPMPGNTESLNAAVAGSIALYLSSQSK